MNDYEFDSLFCVAGVENSKEVFINLLYYLLNKNDNELLKEFLIHELFIYEDIELFKKSHLIRMKILNALLKERI